tara:strand:- start:3276 stop:4109 length:834 start_codon:yes stop_codon:yes gene_type:complete
LDREKLALLANNVENLGFGSLWFPEATSFESFSLAAYLLANSSELIVGTGIANIYARDAVTSAQGHDGLNALFKNRFILGLGVSHVSFVEEVRGHKFGKPVSSMNEYLEKLGNASIDSSLRMEDRNVILAALGPRMLELAAAKSKGAIPYSVTPDYTAKAREVLGPKAWLCIEQKVCLTNSLSDARFIAKKQMDRYLRWPNYVSNWLRMGFKNSDLEGEGSPKFLDAMVCWGSDKRIMSCLEQHFSAGADHVVIQALRPDGKEYPDFDALKALSQTS